jgi:hypothetical protein
MKTTTPYRKFFRGEAFSLALLTLTVLVLHRAPGLAVSINVISPPPVQQSGDTGRVCVALNSAGDQVAATENRLVWDANCASLVDKCVASSAHGKQLMSNQPTTNQLKAIVISLQDTNPIPDGELYCCTFRLDLSRGGSCCAVGIQDMGASDPEGGALSTAGRGGQLCLASGAGGPGPQGGTGGGPPPPLTADLGAAPPPPAVGGQPAGQQAAPQRVPGGGSTVLGGGTGGVPGGIGGVPGGVGGVPGGVPGAAPQAPGQPGQLAQQQAEIPAPAAPGPDAARPQAPVPGAPERAPVAAAATPGITAAPAASAAPAAPAQQGAPGAKPASAKPTIAVKAAAPAPTASGSGCSCEITASDSGYDGWPAFIGLVALLWAKRRRM